MKQEEKQQDYMIYLARRTFEPSGERIIPPPDKLEYYIVQFNKPLTSEEQERIRLKYRLRLDTYIPNLAFLERLNPQTLAALSKDSLSRAIALYQPSDKISPEIGKSSSASSAQRSLNDLLIRVFLFSDVKDNDISRVAEAIGSLRASHMLKNKTDAHIQPSYESNPNEPNAKDSAERLSVTYLDPAEIRILNDRDLGGHAQLVFLSPSIDLLVEIAKLDEVQWIEEVAETDSDSSATVHCPNSNTVAGTIQSGTPANVPVWDNGINGSQQIVGIIDVTLVDKAHCMFRDFEGIGTGMDHRKVVGFRDFFNTGGNKHGTAVAAIAVGDEFRNSGNNENRGIAWAARLSYDDQKIIRSLRRTMLEVLAVEAGDEAMIHSNSWHDNTTAYNKTAVDVDTFVWQNEEHFVCGSSGNSNSAEVLGPPGTAKNALCVAASRGFPKHSQHGDGLSGPTSRPDNRRKPEICAPGCGINAAEAGSGCGCMSISRCATSFATPVIAGAAALVRQYYMEGFYPTGVRDLPNHRVPSGALIKATLLNSTIPMTDEQDYPNNREGWGLIKLDNTLFFAGGPRNLFIADVLNADGLSKGQSRAHNITVRSNTQPLKITLVWSDPPATIGTGKALVNDLNLIVTSPDGDIFRGNINFSGGFSLPQPQPVADDSNNVEMVIVQNPVPGTWTIKVECVAANIGLQGYALVATAAIS
jgi:hypothetical protein